MSDARGQLIHTGNARWLMFGSVTIGESMLSLPRVATSYFEYHSSSEGSFRPVRASKSPYADTITGSRVPLRGSSSSPAGVWSHSLAKAIPKQLASGLDPTHLGTTSAKRPCSSCT